MEDYKAEVLKRVDLNKLNFPFTHPPILVSGTALMYYGLRESTKDIDLIVSREDHKRLALHVSLNATILEEDSKSGYKEKPEFVDIYEDHGILLYEYEIWDSIHQIDYEYLKQDAVKENNFLVISLEKLLVLCFIRGLKNQRYMEDAKLVGGKIEVNLYKDVIQNKNEYWKKLLNI
jgi:hypothetical protein